MNNFSINSIPVRTRSQEKAIILHLNGPAQPATYQTIIQTVKSMLASGHTHVIVDLSDVNLLNLTTLFALFSMTALAHELEPPPAENGWNALYTLIEMLNGRQISNVSLVAPQPGVSQVLQQSGLANVVSIFPTVNQAYQFFAPRAVPETEMSSPLFPTFFGRQSVLVH